MIIDNNTFKSGALNVGDCYYCAIIAISKRAREIVDQSGNCPDNPVKEAYEEFNNGQFVIEVHEN